MPRLFVTGALSGRATHDELAGSNENPPIAFNGSDAAQRIIHVAIAIIVAEVADLLLPRVHPRILIVTIRALRAAATKTITVAILATHVHCGPGRPVVFSRTRPRDPRGAPHQHRRTETNKTYPNAQWHKMAHNSRTFPHKPKLLARSVPKRPESNAQRSLPQYLCKT